MSLGGRNYSTVGSYTLVASATLPVTTLISTAAVRPRLYEFDLGSSGAPANQASRFTISRVSTTGTVGSSVTASPIDPGDPASVTTAGLGTFSVAPTAGVVLMQFGLNQQATFRWLANPGGELIMPATAANGLELLSPAVSSAWAAEFTMFFSE